MEHLKLDGVSRKKTRFAFLESYLEQNEYDKIIDTEVLKKYKDFMDSLPLEKALDIYNYEVELFNSIVGILVDCPYLEIKI